jgi:hypothetical protein
VLLLSRPPRGLSNHGGAGPAGRKLGRTNA